MALNKIESKNDSLLFFDAWAKEFNHDYLEEVVGQVIFTQIIKEVQSGKGYLLNFNHDFMIFIWKNSAVGKTIKNFIKDESGYAIGIEFVLGKKGLTYEMGIDEDYPISLVEDKFEEGVYLPEGISCNPPIAPLSKEDNKPMFKIGYPQRSAVKLTTTSKKK